MEQAFWEEWSNKRISARESAARWWRLRNKCLAAKGGLAKGWWTYRYRKHMLQMGAHIPLRAQFDSLPTMPHGIYGTFISLGAKIGKGCVIFQQVTIGSNTVKGSKRIGSPIIGDNVYIGAGAKIIGNVTIGNNARIGANCVVVNDVPDNATVVLGNNRVLEHDFTLDNAFYYYDQVKDSIPKAEDGAIADMPVGK